MDMVTKSFFRFFPTPSFLEMPVAGLDISDRSVRFVRFKEKRGILTLHNFGQVALPEGTIVAGEIKNRSALVEVLTEVVKKNNFKFVKVSLPEEKAYLFRTELPKVAPSEIRNLLEFKLEENVPLAPSEVIFEYDEISSVGQGQDAHLDVSVSAVPERFVSVYTDAIEAAGLMPVGFEVEAKAFTRALVKSGEAGTSLVVLFGGQKTIISIISNGSIYFSSTVSVNGAMLTSAIAKAMKISNSEAEKIKLTKGILGLRDNLDVLSSVATVLSALKDEIDRVAIYWAGHEKEIKERGLIIDRIVFGGRDTEIPGFASYMRAVLKIPVVVGNVWVNAFTFEKYIPDITRHESLDYASAIGLALPDVKYKNPDA